MTINLLGLPERELANTLAGSVDRPFRVGQIYRAIHQRGVTDFAAITELGQALRQELAARYSLALPEVASRQRANDGTTKFLLRLADGATIEAVDIPTPRRRTYCISSQAGCALACRFCVTGYWGAGRNLTAAEIVGQVYRLRAELAEVDGVAPAPEAEQETEEGGLNLVFMGMGEPLLNLPEVARAIEILTGGISWRRITVSTAGVVPGIDELAQWPRRPNLAISLHAPDDERRSELMPINRTYPLAELLAALERFPLEPGRRLTFEYLLIAGFNDALRDADALVRRLARLRAKVNLIPLNPDPVLGDLQAPAPDVVAAFRQRLQARGLVATVRTQRGDEVSGACGQLRAFGRAPRTFAGRNLGPARRG
jgi:23S rRNA (adenine2503-C2)-methyltransferase